MIRIYYRVSTDKQDYEMQDNAIKTYLKTHEINLDKCVLYQDLGISGTTTQRPEYQRLLSEVLENDIVLVYEFSRLWRDMEEQSRVTKMFLALCITVTSVTEGSVRTEEDSLLSDFKGVINQHEARRIRRRSTDGVKAKRERIAKGEDTWKGRGPDKQKRRNEGYIRRYAKNEV